MELTREERIIVDTFYLDPALEDKTSAEEFLLINGYEGKREEAKFKEFLELKKSEIDCHYGEELAEKFDTEYTEV